MSNRQKIHQPRPGAKEMARDNRKLIETGRQMCELLAFIHDISAKRPSGGLFRRAGARKQTLSQIASMTMPWRGFKIEQPEAMQ